MSTSQTESARHFYDRISGVYDALADASEHRARELGLRLLSPAGGQRVLEIGFGTGHALVEIAERLSPRGRVFGIDVSPGMLDVAQKRVDAAAVRERVEELRIGDAKEMPYRSAWFDAVFLSFTLELFSAADMSRVLAEISRVLRPEGRLGVVSMHDDGRKSTMVDLFRFLHRHFPHIFDCRPIDVRSHLERAGFEVVASEGISIWGLPVLAAVARLRAAGASGA